MSIIHPVLKAVIAAQPQRVVFDLDSTLFCVSHRTQQILIDLSGHADLVKISPLAANELKNVKVEAQDWGIRSALSRHQVLAPQDFFVTLKRLWSELFFSDHYLQFDQPYSGAVDYVQRLQNSGVEIFYLTGRDRPRMGLGTVESLVRHGFPLASEKHLAMKPEVQRHDEEFKSQYLRDQKLTDPKTWFFENEPVIINRVRPVAPDLSIVFVDTVHSQRENPPLDLPRLEAIKGYF